MADMSDMLKNLSSMMEGKEIPDNIKELFQSIQNNNNSDKTNPSSNESNSNNSQNVPNIDMESILKIQKIMNTMNKSSNSTGANLLRSLKPYLNPNRQEKVDEYIQLFNMEQMIELLRKSGGDSKI